MNYTMANPGAVDRQLLIVGHCISSDFPVVYESPGLMDTS